MEGTVTFTHQTSIQGIHYSPPNKQYLFSQGVVRSGSELYIYILDSNRAFSRCIMNAESAGAF